MKNITSKILTHENDIFYFQQRVKYILGIEFPISYLKKGVVRGFMDEKGQLVGGYALILWGEFRTLSSIPKGEASNLVDESDVMEVTALWRDKSLKCGLSTFQFWYTFSKDILAQKNKKYMVYAYDLSNEKLKNLYSRGNPTILFRGETKKLEGMSYQSIESIEVVPSKTMAYLPFISLPYFAKKTIWHKAKMYRSRFEALLASP